MTRSGDTGASTSGSGAPAWRRRLVAIGLSVFAVAAVIGIVGRILAATPLGTALLENRLDGQSLGGLGTLRVEGVSGDLLRDVRVAHLSILDADGAWLEVVDARVRWRPTALFSRTLRVDLMSAERVDVARRPPSDGANESPDGSGGTWRIRLEEARFPDVGLGEDLVGAAARLSADAQFVMSGDGRVALSADVVRTDAPGDTAEVRFNREPGGEISGRLHVEAAPGGPMAALLGESESGLSADGDVGGDAGAGAGAAVVRVGDAVLLDVDVVWEAGAVRAEGRADLSASALTRDVAARLGGPVEFEGDLAAPTRNGLRDVVATLTAPAIQANLSGPIDLQRRAAPDGLSASVTSDRPDDLLQLDAASLDRFAWSGRLGVGDRTALQGEVWLDGLTLSGAAFESVSGPLTASLVDGVAGLTAELAVSGVSGVEAAALLGESAVVGFDASARLDLSAAELRSLSVEGDSILLNGTAAFDGAAGIVTADFGFEARDLSGLPTVDGGDMVGAVRIETPAAGGPVRVDAEASGSGLAFASAGLFDLAGAAPSAVVRGEWADGRFTIQNASVTGARLVADVAGSAGFDAFDLDVDAAVDGPFGIGPVEFAGAIAVGARLEGAPATPKIRVDARAGSVRLGDRTLDELRVRVDADGGDAWSGRAQVDGAYDANQFNGAAQFRAASDGVDASDISGAFADWTLGGGVAARGGGPATGVVTLRQGDGRVAVTANFLDRGGAQAFDVSISTGAVDLNDTTRLSQLDARLTGGFDAVDIAIDVAGEAAERFNLSVRGDVSVDETIAGSFEIGGAVGDRAITTTTPITLLLSDDAAAVAGGLGLGGGRLDVGVRRPSSGAAAVEATLRDFPLDVINAFVPEPHIVGTLEGDMSLSGEVALEGTFALRARGVRDPNAEANAAVSADFSGVARGGRVTGEARVADVTELAAEMRIDYPVTLRPAPPFVDVRKDAAFSASAQAEGPIANIASLILGEDRAARGDLLARAEMTGTPADPKFSGDIRLSDGRFEDGGVGFVLAEATAAARFDGPRLVLESFTATDGDGGRVVVTGAADFAAEDDVTADVAIELTEMRLSDRADARLVASGATNLSRRDGQSRVDANVHVDRADFEPPEAGPPGVVTLDVTELNRPARLEPPPPRRGPPVLLNVKFDADRRVFVRSQGLQTEWAFDVTVTGTARDPVIIGTATLIKGDLEIVGERFDLEDGVITLDGDVASARLNMTARRQAEDLVAIVTVTGTPEQPMISLSSEPAYPEDEILARVLFGRTASQLSALEAAQLAAALATLANGGGGFDFLGSLRRGLGVDRLSVSRAEGGAVVSGGKYIADNVYFEVSGGGDGGAAEAAIEWEIRPRVELVSKFGSQSDASLSLRWRRDY